MVNQVLIVGHLTHAILYVGLCHRLLSLCLSVIHRQVTFVHEKNNGYIIICDVHELIQCSLIMKEITTKPIINANFFLLAGVTFHYITIHVYWSFPFNMVA